MLRNRIRILHVLEATTGGTRRHLSDIVFNLNTERFDVSVLCAALRDPAFLDDVADMRAHGADVTIIRMLREIHPLVDARALRQTRQHLRRGKYDIVHTHSSKAGILGRIAARQAGIPAVVHTPHAFAFQMDVAWPRRVFYALLERRAARFTDRIVCVCPSERAQALSHRIAPPERLTVIENAIDPQDISARCAAVDRDSVRRSFGFNPQDLVVGMAARFTHQKGHDVLVNAVSQLAPAMPLRLLLPGAGKCKRAIKALIRRRGLADTCRLPDTLDDVSPFYAAVDVFVLPSRWEGLPYSLLDAMAAGKPIVASNSGGVSDTLQDGRTGLLVEPADTVALAGALERVLKDADLRTRLGRQARRAVERRDNLKQMIGKLENLYRAIYDASVVGSQCAPRAAHRSFR